MPVFTDDDNPLTDVEWQEVNSVVTDIARRRLVGRRLIDIYGPLGAGVQTIVHDYFDGTTIGRIGLMGEEGSDALRPVRRQSGIIPLIYKDFLVHWRDIQFSRQTGSPIDTSAAAGAASFCADAEDDLILNGEASMAYEGLCTVHGRHTLARRDWTNTGNAFLDVVDATRTLSEAGFYGPYGMVVNPVLYSQMQQVHTATGVLEIEHVKKLATDGVYQSPLVHEGCAIILATGSQNFDLAVAQDLTVAYLGADNLNHPYRVLESVYLRIKRPGAICTLEPRKTGKK
ncbi:MAG TPA: family 1 encapsulin nanocompartment shell protein [Blastocatellia bacterium]|nr:family 1 encapsulin nanocompartment shell protein [Blastocatellia bacterium]